ncbi:hypothetical protein AVEN_221441-1, partial [Araneus ventricosus]
EGQSVDPCEGPDIYCADGFLFLIRHRSVPIHFEGFLVDCLHFQVIKFGATFTSVTAATASKGQPDSLDYCADRTYAPPDSLGYCAPPPSLSKRVPHPDFPRLTPSTLNLSDFVVLASVREARPPN